MVLGRTDARHYEVISDCILRFSPMRVGAEDKDRAHGTDERIGVENFREMISFYTRIIRASD